ncbi:hypothetical protein VKS41_009014 [Umbelopsis sp. WA50703]
MLPHNSNDRDKKGASKAPIKSSVGYFPSGTDSSPGPAFAPVGGFALESESAIEADASTVDTDSDSTALLSSSNPPTYLRTVETGPAYRSMDKSASKYADRYDRARPSVDSDASSSPTLEKNTLMGTQSHTTLESRKPIPTDIPTPSSGYQADTEILETEESHGAGASQQHYQHGQHSHSHRHNTSKMD